MEPKSVMERLVTDKGLIRKIIIGLVILALLSPLLGILGGLSPFFALSLGMGLLQFFLGARTGTLLSTVQENPAFWLVVAASVAYVLHRWWTHRKTFGVTELLAQFAISYMLILFTMTQLMAGSHDTEDIKVASEPLHSAEYHEPYTAVTSDGETYAVDGVRHLRYDEDGFFKKTITAEQYAALRDFCGNETVREVARDGQVSRGDGRLFRVDCMHAAYPVAVRWLEANYIAASRTSILAQEGRLPEIRALAERLGLADAYPDTEEGPFGSIEFRRFHAPGLDVPEDAAGAAEQVLDQASLAATLADRHMGYNPMMVVVDTDADANAVADALAWRWRAPKATDVILVVNAEAGSGTVRWARVLALTQAVGIPSDIEAAILGMERFDPVAAAETFTTLAAAPDGRLAFPLEDPESYSYLAAGFDLTWTDILILLAVTLAGNWLTTRFFAWFNPVIWTRRLFGRKTPPPAKG